MPVDDFKDSVKEAHSFDELAKGLANGTLSRGRALKLLGASFVSTLLLPFAPSVAMAANPKCPSGGPGCSARCKNTGGGTCFCVKQTNGHNTCVVSFCGGAKCGSNSKCPSGWVCSTTAAKCCGRSVPKGKGICVPKCTTSSSAVTAAPSDAGSWNTAA